MVIDPNNKLAPASGRLFKEDNTMVNWADILAEVFDQALQALRGRVVSIDAGADPHAASTWSITATADNAAATVTRAGEAGKSHFITSISGSFSAAAIKLLTLKDGAAIIGNFHVHNQREIVFAKPIKITAGAAAELSLAASGTAAVIGAVTMTGYTI